MKTQKDTRRWCFVALVGVAVACSEPETPVGRLAVSPDLVTLDYPGHVPLELRFEFTEPLDRPDPSVFVHLLDGDGNVVRTFDHVLPGRWEPGTEMSYELPLHQSALAPPLTPGVYDLTIGLHDGPRRWPLENEGLEVDDQEYALAKVNVPADSGDGPMFYFSPEWLASEAGTDVQILGRRWLVATGTIRATEISRPGQVWMRVLLREAENEGEEVVLLEGHEDPGFAVRSTCGSQDQAFTGWGRHEILVGVTLDEGSEECEIVIEPFSHLLARDTLETKALQLEALSWGG